MTIPFLRLFKWMAKEQPAKAPVPKPALVAEKHGSARLSKTVLPSAARAASAQNPFYVGAGSSPTESSNGAFSPAGRTISFGSPPASRTPDLPPALAFALEPKVERVVSLELGDIVPQMPSGWVKALNEDDAARRVLLKAAELERGMANGKPSVSIATIYRQVPEIFLRPVEASDTAQVRLPFGKVLEQFTNLQQRSDQYREQSVPQVETPFLKVTLEDNQRFGTTTEALETGDLPAVRVQPATADSIAAAEPEPAAQEKAPPPIVRFPIPFPAQPEAKKNGTASPAPAPVPRPAAPTRIPFKLSPIGTDAPTSESVPASNGASVPTSPLPPAGPTRIPFKVSAPSEDVRPKAEPWLTKENFGMEGEPAPAAAENPVVGEGTNGHHKPAEITISLPLKPILNALPPFQLTGNIDEVPEEARLELPFSLVEPQLTSGRVSIKPDDFSAALPEKYRTLFSAKDIAAPVALPLQEVLKNLPVASLRMREDQEEQEIGENFATPFSTKAEEDAKRFNLSSAPVAKVSVEPTAPVAAAVESAPITKDDSEPAETGEPQAGERVGLQALFETGDELDAKAVVARVSEMPGLKACAIMFGDGLSLAGNLPEELQADGLCALAPSMLQRVENHLLETHCGALRAMTLSCANASITFLMQDNLCLAGLHAGGELTAETRERLGRVVQELSQKYSHPV